MIHTPHQVLQTGRQEQNRKRRAVRGLTKRSKKQNKAICKEKSTDKLTTKRRHFAVYSRCDPVSLVKHEARLHA
jgi:hypothetical protein